MAHDLNFTNGKADMFSVGETPWHGLGSILRDAPTYAEALKLAHLDYQVIREPMYRRISPDGYPVEASEKSDRGFFTTREDTGRILGVVGPDYQVVQNTEAFEVLEPLLDSGVAALETGGTLRGGADAWLMVRWVREKLGEKARAFFTSQNVETFGIVSTNHTGRRGVLLQETPIRVVCRNTLMASEGSGADGVTVRHTLNARTRLVEAAATLWAGVSERYDGLAEAYNALLTIRLTVDQFLADVVHEIAPDPRTLPTFNPEARMANAVVERYEAKRDAFQAAWLGGKGQNGAATGWDAYNGMVEVLDFNAELFPNRSGVYRTESLLRGTLAQHKRAVLANLLRRAASDDVERLPAMPLVA